MGTKESGNQPILVSTGYKNVPRTVECVRDYQGNKSYMYSNRRQKQMMMIMQPSFTIHQCRAMSFENGQRFQIWQPLKLEWQWVSQRVILFSSPCSVTC